RRRLAKGQMLLGHWEDACRELHLCMTLLPGLPALISELGVCYLHLNQPGNAIVLFDQALRIEPGHRLAKAGLEETRRMNESSGPESIVYGLIRFDLDSVPDPPPRAWLLDEALAVTQPEEAAERLFEVLLLNPTCAQAYFALAGLEESKGRLAWARLYYERAVRCATQAWQPYYNLARLYVED